MIADLSRNRRIALALEVVFELFIAIEMKIACSGIVGLIVRYSLIRCSFFANLPVFFFFFSFLSLLLVLF